MAVRDEFRSAVGQHLDQLNLRLLSDKPIYHGCDAPHLINLAGHWRTAHTGKAGWSRAIFATGLSSHGRGRSATLR